MPIPRLISPQDEDTTEMDPEEPRQHITPAPLLPLLAFQSPQPS